MFTDYVLIPRFCYDNEGFGEGKITGVFPGALQDRQERFTVNTLDLNYLTEYLFKPENKTGESPDQQ